MRERCCSIILNVYFDPPPFSPLVPPSQFRSLFVHSVPADVSMALWDCYLLESDPYIIFHMSLVLLINAR